MSLQYADTHKSLRGYKVTNAQRKRMVGIACSSLEELKIKGCLKLEKDVSQIQVYLNDGTIIDDELYFKMLPSQTVLILKQPDEKLLTGFDIIYRVFKTINVELLRTASEIKDLFDTDTREKIQILSNYLNECDGERLDKNIKLSRRLDDEDWFEGIETNAKTKEEFMRKRGRNRVQGYYYGTKDGIRSSTLYSQKTGKCVADLVLGEFLARLRRDDYFGNYFDRTAADGSLCDRSGWFVCQGIWNADECNVRNEHRINPYRSKQDRIVFGTWNLDHRIERSRRIVPALLKAIEMCSATNAVCNVNVDYFYSLLFTTKNLKLVHIVCHDKNEHKTADCDLTKLVIRETGKKVLKRHSEADEIDCMWKKSIVCLEVSAFLGICKMLRREYRIVIKSK